MSNKLIYVSTSEECVHASIYHIVLDMQYPLILFLFAKQSCGDIIEQSTGHHAAVNNLSFY